MYDLGKIYHAVNLVDGTSHSLFKNHIARDFLSFIGVNVQEEAQLHKGDVVVHLGSSKEVMLDHGLLQHGEAVGRERHLMGTKQRFELFDLFFSSAFRFIDSYLYLIISKFSSV